MPENLGLSAALKATDGGVDSVVYLGGERMRTYHFTGVSFAEARSLTVSALTTLLRDKELHASVRFGVYTQRSNELIGMRVESARVWLRSKILGPEMLDGSIAWMSTDQLPETYTIKPGDVIEFRRVEKPEFATLRFSIFNQPSPQAVGMDISQAREWFARRLGDSGALPRDAIAYKGSEQLSNSYIIQRGDIISFHRPKAAPPTEIRYGANRRYGQSIIGKSVAWARNWAGLPHDTAAYLDGVLLSEDYRIQECDRIEFHRRLGSTQQAARSGSAEVKFNHISVTRESFVDKRVHEVREILLAVLLLEQSLASNEEIEQLRTLPAVRLDFTGDGRGRKTLSSDYVVRAGDVIAFYKVGARRGHGMQCPSTLWRTWYADNKPAWPPPCDCGQQ